MLITPCYTLFAQNLFFTGNEKNRAAAAAHNPIATAKRDRVFRKFEKNFVQNHVLTYAMEKRRELRRKTDYK